VVGINVVTFRQDSELLALLTDTVASVFPFVHRLRVGNADVAFDNVVVVASAARPRVTGLAEAFPGAPPELLRWVEERLEVASPRPEPRVLTDDWAPVEWYVDRSLFGFFDG